MSPVSDGRGLFWGAKFWGENKVQVRQCTERSSPGLGTSDRLFAEHGEGGGLPPGHTAFRSVFCSVLLCVGR